MGHSKAEQTLPRTVPCHERHTEQCTVRRSTPYCNGTTVLARCTYCALACFCAVTKSASRTCRKYNELLCFLTVEWRVASQEDISDNTDAPHIHGSTVRAGLEDLRRHIYGSAASSAARGQDTVSSVVPAIADKTQPVQH